MGVAFGTLLTIEFLPVRALIRLYIEIWRGLPLIVFLHGLLNSKGEYLSKTRAGTGPDLGRASETVSCIACRFPVGLLAWSSQLVELWRNL